MSLTKETIVDKAETVKKEDHYLIQIREKNQILEDGKEISASFHRYILEPNHDASKITDPIVKAQFQAVMTDTIKANYAKFLEDRDKEVGGE